MSTTVGNLLAWWEKERREQDKGSIESNEFIAHRDQELDEHGRFGTEVDETWL